MRPRSRWLGSSTSALAITSSYLSPGSEGLNPRGAGAAWASCTGKAARAAASAAPAALSEAPAAVPAATEVRRMKSRRDRSMVAPSTLRCAAWSAPRRDLDGLGYLALLAFLDEPLHLVHELRDVLELAVDGREAHVGDLVELLEVLHDDLAQLLGGDLLLRAFVELGLDLRHHVVHRLHADGALLARLEDGAAQLLAVERLAAVVALHHVREHVLDVLVGGVPAVALETFAPAAD